MILKSIAGLWWPAGGKVPEAGFDQQPIQVETTIRESLSDQASKIMIGEIADLKKGMREFLLSCEKYVNFGGIIAVGAVTLGIIRKDTSTPSLILVFAPYPLGLTYIYLIQIFTEIEMRAGYVRFLEEKVCAHAESAVLVFSQISSSKDRSRASTWGVMGLNAIALLFLGYLSIINSAPFYGTNLFHEFYLNLHYLNIGLLLLMLSVIGMATWEMTREGDRAYGVAATAYADFPSSSAGSR
ncbi:MAG TPA: hypothetical protein VN408_14990 [Actinoplanes sp.]|nr:hypothetical protein [Actinoplanes sp.]